MSSKKSKDAFLYQINFNRRKYPEICDALEKAKKDNGIAWYLRQLIMKDIEERKRRGEKFKTADEIMLPDDIEEEEKERPKEPRKETKEVKIEVKETKKEPEKSNDQIFIDDSGGFL
jgi:hypothetical protein